MYTADAAEGLHPPTNDNRLRSFLRLCNVFRLSIANTTLSAATLNNMVKENQSKHLTALIARKLRAVSKF